MSTSRAGETQRQEQNMVTGIVLFTFVFSNSQSYKSGSLFYFYFQRQNLGLRVSEITLVPQVVEPGSVCHKTCAPHQTCWCQIRIMMV
jgi:hypothetical protein